MTTIDQFVSIRELAREDLNFILDSALQCLTKYTESIVKGQAKQTAYRYIEYMVLHALNKNPNYSVFIACHKEDSNNIIGYIVADTQDNHIFLQYTKYSYRKLGIQKNLLLPLVSDPDKTITVNWPTKEMLKLASVGRVEIQNKFVEQLIKDSV
jgi:hypothetical protein